jgi:hypothetical protein
MRGEGNGVFTKPNADNGNSHRQKTNDLLICLQSASRALAELSHFGGFAQRNLLKFGETDAKVFTTEMAGRRVRSQRAAGLETL